MIQAPDLPPVLFADPRTGKPIGLALLMARDIVAAHRGSIHVQSKLGEGASFVVRHPRGSP